MSWDTTKCPFCGKEALILTSSTPCIFDFDDKKTFVMKCYNVDCQAEIKVTDSSDFGYVALLYKIKELKQNRSKPFS